MLDKLKQVFLNPLFRVGVSILTLGTGTYFFFRDFSKWLNSKLETNKKTGCVRLMTTGSLLDNGIGLTLSQYGTKSKGAWKDHATATAVQFPLLIFQDKLQRMNDYLPTLLLVLSLVL